MCEYLLLSESLLSMKSRAELHKNVLKGALGICGFDEAPELQGLIRESIMIGLTGSGARLGAEHQPQRLQKTQGGAYFAPICMPRAALVLQTLPRSGGRMHLSAANRVNALVTAQRVVVFSTKPQESANGPGRR